MRGLLGVLVFLVLACLLLFPFVAFASYDYYITVAVYNNDSVERTYLPLLITVNNTQLVSLGYINSSGLDTSLQEGSVDREFMVEGSRLAILIPSISGYQGRVYNYRLGDSLGQTTFPIIVGVGGNVTVPDATTLEPGSSDFTLLWEGYINTSTAGSIFEKANAYGFEVSPSGNLTAYAGYGTNYMYLYPDGAGGHTNIPTVVGNATHWGAVDDPKDSPDDTTSYVALEGQATYYEDEYTLTNPGYIPSGSTISEVRVYFRDAISSDQNSNIRPSLELDGSTTVGSPIEPTGYDNWVTHSEALARPGGGSWALTDLDDLRARIAIKSCCGSSYWIYCTQAYVRVTYTPPEITVAKASGDYALNMTKAGTSLELLIDDVSVETIQALVNVVDNSSGLLIDGDTAIVTDGAQIYVAGVQRLWFEPNTMVSTTNLPDRSGNGNTGTMNWGTNPSGIEVTVGGLAPATAYVPPGGEAGEAPEVLPPPPEISFIEDAGATGEGLPLYENFLRAGNSLGWTVPTTYVVFIGVMALGFGFGGMVATGSVWGFVMGFGAIMVAAGGIRDSGGYAIVPWWISLVSLMFAIFLAYVWRQVG